MIVEGWQIPFADHIVVTMKTMPSVQGIIQYGSTASDTSFDLWSDIDLLIVIEDSAIGEFYPSVDWISALGRLLAVEQYHYADRTVTRVCFSDLRRVDFVFTPVSALSTIQDWGAQYLLKRTRVRYAKSSIIHDVFTKSTVPPAPPLISPEDFNRLVNRFWFRQVTAVAKVIRGDLLIGLHLALESVQDCCVLAMLHRDRETGTSHHQTGGVWNRFVAELDDNRRSYSPTGILESLADSSELFDQLAKQWDFAYESRRKPILDWIAMARASILATQ